MKKSRKKAARRLTVGEIELLEILWRNGPSSIADVHAAMKAKIGYTTVQTRLNRLVGKAVAAKSADRPARYRAAISPEDINRADLDVLVDRVNDGSVVPLVAQLIRDQSITSDELSELRKLIDEADRQQSRCKEESHD